MREYLAIRECAERLGVGTRQAYRMVRAGTIPAVRQGRSIRVPKTAWEAWQARMTAEALASLKEGEARAKAAS